MKGGYWVIIVVFVVACSSDNLEKGYLSKDEMALVMLDLYEAEVYMSINQSSVPNTELYPILRDEALEKHRITDSVFNANMEYYLLHPKLLNEVYDIIIDSVKLRQQVEDPIQEEDEKPGLN